MCRQPSVPTENCCRCLAPRPGGMPQEISRGQARISGRGPGCRVKRAMPQRGIGDAFGARPSPRAEVGPTAMVRHPGPFLRCPAGARSHSSPLPGAASAADLPPANFLRRPSGTGTGRPRPDHGKAPAREWRSQVVRLRLRRSVLQLFRILARREDFSRSAAVCAEHQPQQVGRLGRRRFHPVPARFRGRCGWSSADTAALLGLRLHRTGFIVSLWFSRRFPLHRQTKPRHPFTPRSHHQTLHYRNTP